VILELAFLIILSYNAKAQNLLIFVLDLLFQISSFLVLNFKTASQGRVLNAVSIPN
jgi:hypothetical protein